MDDQKLAWVRERAYYLWLEAGKPEGEQDAHWFKAVEEAGLDPKDPENSPENADPIEPGEPTILNP